MVQHATAAARIGKGEAPKTESGSQACERFPCRFSRRRKSPSVGQAVTGLIERVIDLRAEDPQSGDGNHRHESDHEGVFNETLGPIVHQKIRYRTSVHY
jgi:hypothetical protein